MCTYYKYAKQAIYGVLSDIYVFSKNVLYVRCVINSTSCSPLIICVSVCMCMCVSV